MSNSSDIDRLTREILQFRDDRNWRQFHNSKDIALALSIEAAELNEVFLWKSPEDADKTKLAEELADVFIFALLLAHENSLNVVQIVTEKLEVNAKKYTIDKSKDTANKYTELE